jgi:hemerythrin
MTMEALHWKSEYACGFAPMDEVHREFLDCVNALMTCDEGALPSALEAFSAHAISHFAEEDRMMAMSAYPPAGCHVAEQAAVLSSLAEVQQALTSGIFSVVRRFAAELARWFPEHASSMDHGLARWAVRQRLGGAPVALHLGSSSRSA